VGHDLDVRVELVQPVPRRLHLGPAHVVRVVQQLALEVRELDLVEVDQPERSHTGRGQVHRRR
jgi:hypothetical protein